MPGHLILWMRSSRTEMNREHIVYSLGQLSFVAATFIFNLIAARFLGPELMGIWQTATLISIYGMVVTLGILNGMGREVPVRLGRDDIEGAAVAVATAFWPLVLLVLMLLIAALVAATHPPWAANTLWMGLFLLSARLINAFSTMLLRSFQRFSRLGLQQAATAVLLGLGLLWLWRSPTLPTLLMVMLLALVGGTVLALDQLRLRPFAFSMLGELIAVGTPIMLAGLLFSLLTTVDRLLIVGLLGTRELGLYTPVIAALGAVMIAPALVSNVMYPRLGQLYGKSGLYEDLFPPVRRMIRWNYLATVPVAAAFGVAFYCYVVPHVLPAYTEARIPLIIVLTSTLFLPLAQSFGDFFNVIGWQRRYLRNMAIGFIVNGSVGYLLVAFSGLGLTGVALGTVCGMAAFALVQFLTFQQVQLGSAASSVRPVSPVRR